MGRVGSGSLRTIVSQVAWAVTHCFRYEDIISWAEMYDQANLEAKKMIVNCLIKRVEVYRDYKLHIDFNIDLEQFSLGKDIVTIAA